ncbi:MAG: hypothetical protein H6873_05690 [Hyphomicrobiaceae bacterium]|nr:hypothetical protein [Hyphomicrobiaceae bacterium]
MTIRTRIFDAFDGLKTYITSLAGMAIAAADIVVWLFQNLSPAELGNLQAITLDIVTRKPGSLLSLVFFVLTFLARMAATRPGPIGQGIINRRIRDGLIEKRGE